MKKCLWLLLLLGFLPEARAQTVPVTTLTAAGTTCVAASATAGSFLMAIVRQNEGAMSFTINANAGGNTISFYASGDGGKTYATLSVTPSNSTTTVTSTASTTAGAVWRASVAGYTNVCMIMTTQASGNSVVNIYPSTASALGIGAGGVGAVSSVFTRTGAVTAAANDYTLDQIGNPAAVKSFALGTNFPLSVTSAGIFTATVQRDYLTSQIGGACPSHTLIGGAYTTDAILGCVVGPASGQTNGFIAGVNGLAQVNDSTQDGQYGGPVIGVGVNGTAGCSVSNTKCIGSAFIGAALVGTSHFLEGSEITAFPIDSTDTGYGVLMSMEGATAQSTNMPAMDIQSPSNAGTWTTGFQCDAHATSTNNCIYIGPTQVTAQGNSQSIKWNWNDAGSVARSMVENVASTGWKATQVPFMEEARVVGTSNPIDGYGIVVTSTNNLTYEELVKVDSANNNSFVACTTADTYCSGFVVDTAGSGTGGLCTAAGTFCAVVTVPGSNVIGIVGTGTCSIGNYVIPDTTTNGRVKCTATEPTTGIIGIALTAQASVGSNVQILTLFTPPIPAAIPIASVGSSGLSGTAPVTISAAGAIGCATCVTSSGGGAETATAPVTVSAAGLIACATCLTNTAKGPTGIFNFNQATQSQVVVSATEYYLTRSDLDMPATYTTAIGAGTTMRWRIALNKTAAGTGTFQILLKKGTNGSTADTSIVTQTIGTQTAAADNMEADIQLTWTSATAAYWTIIPRQSAASGTGFGLVYPAVAAQFNGTISGQTTTTASDKYGISVIFTTGTPTFVATEVSAQAFGVN